MSFGYNNLVADMTSLAEMRNSGAPVVFDVTHSVQKPGGLGAVSGSARAMVPVLARAAVGVGVAGCSWKPTPGLPLVRRPQRRAAQAYACAAGRPWWRWIRSPRRTAFSKTISPPESLTDAPGSPGRNPRSCARNARNGARRITDTRGCGPGQNTMLADSCLR